MTIKIFTLVSYLFTCCILFTACPKECINTSCTFEAKFYCSPQKKQYVIGDTLWLESTFSCKSLLNLLNGKYEAFCDAKNLGSTLGVLQLGKNGTNEIYEVADSFNYINVKGQIYSAGTDFQKKSTKQISFEKIDTNYVFKCAIIPLKKGTYYLGIGNGISNSGSCEKASYSFTIGNTANNIDIYFTYKGSTDISDYERPRGYWFEVK
jgi:hypothetical protein